MILPKIDLPQYQIVLPSNKKSISVRPMLQKDEKILLMAKEGGDHTEILNAIKQVVNNCMLSNITGSKSIDDWALFDLEYAFIKLRGISISNITKVSYQDGEDKEVREFDVDVNKVEVVGIDDNAENRIFLNKDTFITLKYPPASLYSNKDFLNAIGEEALTLLVASIIDKVVQNNEQLKLDKKELYELVANIPLTAYNEIKDWINKLPHLNYEIVYTNNNGNERKIVLSSLNDFFTLA